MRNVGRMAAETLLLVGEKIRAGMTTEDLDRLVAEDTARRGDDFHTNAVTRQ